MGNSNLKHFYSKIILISGGKVPFQKKPKKDTKELDDVRKMIYKRVFLTLFFCRTISPSLRSKRKSNKSLRNYKLGLHKRGLYVRLNDEIDILSNVYSLYILAGGGIKKSGK